MGHPFFTDHTRRIVLAQPAPLARELNAHRVNGLNDVIRVFVLDQPGAGGANHDYCVCIPTEIEHARPNDEIDDAEVPATVEHFRLVDGVTVPKLCATPGVEFGMNVWDDLNYAEIYTAGDLDPVSFNATATALPAEWLPRAYWTMRIRFQNGPVKERGVNGLSNEVMLAVLLDRLEGFQSGKFACHDNEVALDHIQSARLWLHKRTMDRVTRGVEGTLTR